MPSRFDPPPVVSGFLVHPFLNCSCVCLSHVCTHGIFRSRLTSPHLICPLVLHCTRFFLFIYVFLLLIVVRWLKGVTASESLPREVLEGTVNKTTETEAPSSKRDTALAQHRGGIRHEATPMFWILTGDLQHFNLKGCGFRVNGCCTCVFQSIEKG